MEENDGGEISVNVKRAEGPAFAVVMTGDDPIVALQIMVANTIKINRKNFRCKFGEDELEPTSSASLTRELATAVSSNWFFYM